MRDLFEQGEAAHAIAAELRLHMDVVDDLRRENPAPAEDESFGLGRRLDAAATVLAALVLFHRFRPASRLTTPVSFPSARDCRSSTIACRRRSCRKSECRPSARARGGEGWSRASSYRDR